MACCPATFRFGDRLCCLVMRMARWVSTHLDLVLVAMGWLYGCCWIRWVRADGLGDLDPPKHAPDRLDGSNCCQEIGISICLMLMEPDAMICWIFRWDSWLLLLWSIMAGRDTVWVVVVRCLDEEMPEGRCRCAGQPAKKMRCSALQTWDLHV
ncbi:hypothetical protein ACLOJK_036623 [Asimina triloba]